MKLSTIEEIAYLLSEAKKHNRPKPIVFLGAGASVSGGIPLSSHIEKDIIDKYYNNPNIKKLRRKDKNYHSLMECLLPTERNKLLKEYIDKAKINVTHIYLAQLIVENFIDYVLTVNFDNLMLRALALFNFFPPSYDLAILKDLTTTSLHEKSIVYLHGQHHGLWLLNTIEEMNKSKNIISPIFNKITNERAWIIIGYSGNDPIFDYITQLGRFDNGLFWLGHNNNKPSGKVCKNLLEKPNTNASLITGYDADSFMLSLNNELKLSQPEILDKPFSFLKNAILSINDIDEKEYYSKVKERLEITLKQVSISINQFEVGRFFSNNKIEKEVKFDMLKKEIINKNISNDFEELDDLRSRVKKSKNQKLKYQLSALLSNFGWSQFITSKNKTGSEKELLLIDSIEKLSEAVQLDPRNGYVYISLGSAISDLALTKEVKEKEKLLRKGISMYKKGVDIDSTLGNGFYNWGNNLLFIAKMKKGLKQEKLLLESIEKYKKSISIDPDFANPYYNIGSAYVRLSRLKVDDDKINLLRECEPFLIKGSELNNKVYNLACLYAVLNNEAAALKTLEKALSNREVEIDFVITDEDWLTFQENIKFQDLKYRFSKNWVLNQN